MAENKRGRGRPKKVQPATIADSGLSLMQENAILQLTLASAVVLKAYASSKHPTVDQIIKLNDAYNLIQHEMPKLFEPTND
tara:strand:+ start:399 stop:641 length:243 start_codon:yes stop_codon:yes gene_type:complete